MNTLGEQNAEALARLVRKNGGRLLDPEFKYVNAANTDIRKTFERVRRELADQTIRKTP